MANVYIEPRPKGRPEGTPIQDYVIEFAHGALMTQQIFTTQSAAIEAAKKAGHQPLVARVRHTDKGNPDHWRSA